MACPASMPVSKPTQMGGGRALLSTAPFLEFLFFHVRRTNEIRHIVYRDGRADKRLLRIKIARRLRSGLVPAYSSFAASHWPPCAALAQRAAFADFTHPPVFGEDRSMAFSKNARLLTFEKV